MKGKEGQIMLQELIQELTDAIDSGDTKLRDKIFRNLEWVGVDRRTALTMVLSYRKEHME